MSDPIRRGDDPFGNIAFLLFGFHHAVFLYKRLQDSVGLDDPEVHMGCNSEENTSHKCIQLVPNPGIH